MESPDRDQKRLLVISGYAPPSPSGSGLMMYNLLSQFPEGSLTILTSDNNTKAELEQYRLNVPYHYYGNAVTALRFNDKDGGYLQRLKRKIKDFPPTKLLAEIVILAYLPLKIALQGKAIMKHERIDKLLGYSDYGPNLIATYLLHKMTGRPFSLFLYDMYAGNKMPFIFGLVARFLEPKLIRQAEEIFVMCDALQDHYEKKYGRKSTIIYNSIFIDREHLNEIRVPPKDNLKIVYLGSIYWAQASAVVALVNAIERLDLPNVTCTLYTPHDAKYLESLGLKETSRVSFSSCPPDQVQSVFKGADLLILGLAFDTAYPELINTSSPGKLCDYLISGRLILAHAPSDSFLSTYTKRQACAFVVDEPTEDAVVAGLKQVLDATPEEAELKIRAARETALKNHDARKNVHQFLRILA